MSASVDGTIRVWALHNGAELWPLQGYNAGLNDVAYGPLSPEDDTPMIISSDTAGTLMLSSGDDGQVLDRQENLQPVVDFLISADKQRLFVAHNAPGEPISVWDISGTSLNLAFEFDGDGAGHTQSISELDLNPDETMLVSASWDRAIILWDAANGDLLKRLDGGAQGHISPIYAVNFTLDGQSVISASWDGAMIRWDVETGNQSSVTQAIMDKSGLWP